MVKIDRSNVKNSGSWQYSNRNKKLEVCVHETGNTGSGADAKAHAKLQANGNPRQANWHYQVDDKIAIQSYSENAQLWHGGDYTANTIAISVEICVNNDGDYNQAILNAIDLVYDIAKRNKIPISRVKTHKEYSGKNCPTKLLSGKYGWTVSQFKYRVNKLLTGTGSSSSDSGTSNSITSNSSINAMANKIISKRINGHTKRRKYLGVNKSTYEKVRKEVNRIMSGGSNRQPTRSISSMATEIINSRINGHTRRRKHLGISKSRYELVRKEVNRRMR